LGLSWQIGQAFLLLRFNRAGTSFDCRTGLRDDSGTDPARDHYRH
tara:strand:- start:726 stop:860 length:135 start_codon:yes stop_codon:yes gene_type:complete